MHHNATYANALVRVRPAVRSETGDRKSVPSTASAVVRPKVPCHIFKEFKFMAGFCII